MKEWHGLSYHEWTRIMEAGGWRPAVEVALREVAACPRAAVEDRLNAINILNQAILSKQLLPDSGFPVFMRDVLIDIARNGESVPWFFGRRERRRHHARVVGAKWTLQTVAQFSEVEAEEPATPKRTPKIDELLS